MQNKEQPIIDSDFTDKAWEQMHSILDAEMPVQKKRRKLPFFWLILLGCSLGIGFLAIIWTNGERNVPQKIETTQVVADDENTHSATKHTVALQDIPLDTEQTNSMSTDKLPSTPAIKKSISETIENKTQGSAQKSADAKNIERTNIQRDERVVANTETIQRDEGIYATPKLQKEDIRVLKTQEVLSLKSSEAAKRLAIQEKWSNIGRLSTLGIHPFDIESSVPDFSDKKVDFSDLESKKYHIGLQIGGGYDFLNQINFHAGGFWNYEFSPKWSLETGLHYHYFAPQHTNLSGHLEDAAVFETATNSPEPEIEDVTTSSAGGDSESNGLTSDNLQKDDLILQKARHALVLPVQLAYKIKPKWQVYGGGQIAYGFSIGDGLIDANTVRYSIYTQNPKNTFQLWTKAGVRFAMSDALEIDLGYNYSLSRNTSVTVDQQLYGNRQARYHFVDLSLRYRF